MPTSKTNPQRLMAGGAEMRSGIDEVLTMLSSLEMQKPLKTLKTASGKSLKITPLVERFLSAVIESRQSGNKTSFSVDIEPAGTYRIGTLERGGQPVKLRAPTPIPAPREKSIDDALADARARGQQQVAEILAGSEMLTAEQFAKRLGTTRATINTKRKNNLVLGFEGATRGYLYPDWQIDNDGRPFSSLPQLFSLLGGKAWTVYRFLVQTHAELDGLSAREALKRGEDEAVIQVAESVARGDI
jgi:hypothetical protein